MSLAWSRCTASTLWADTLSRYNLGLADQLSMTHLIPFLGSAILQTLPEAKLGSRACPRSQPRPAPWWPNRAPTTSHQEPETSSNLACFLPVIPLKLKMKRSFHAWNLPTCCLRWVPSHLDTEVRPRGPAWEAQEARCPLSSYNARGTSTKLKNIFYF